MPEDGTRPLSELEVLIQAEADAFALLMGNLLDQAYRRAPKGWERWVRLNTPFTVAEAHRLRTIMLVYRDLPAEAIKGLPRPSFALSYVFELQDPTPYMSATERFSREDLAVGALLGADPASLSSDVRRLLAEWLEQGDGESDASGPLGG